MELLHNGFTLNTPPGTSDKMEAVPSLDEQSAKLLTLRFGLEGGVPMTPEQTGKILGMTPEEVVAAEATALMKLRTNG